MESLRKLIDKEITPFLISIHHFLALTKRKRSYSLQLLPFLPTLRIAKGTSYLKCLLLFSIVLMVRLPF